MDVAKPTKDHERFIAVGECRLPGIADWMILDYSNQHTNIQFYNCLHERFRMTVLLLGFTLFFQANLLCQ